MSMTVVFASFAALFCLMGWLSPALMHRLGYRMAAFYLALAVISALIGLVRRPQRR